MEAVIRHADKGNTDRTPCPNCQTEGIDCVRNSRVRFSHAQNPSFDTGRGRRHTFSERQQWVKTDRALSFVDETNDYGDTAVESPGSAGSLSQPPSPSPSSINRPGPTSPPLGSDRDASKKADRAGTKGQALQSKATVASLVFTPDSAPVDLVSGGDHVSAEILDPVIADLSNSAILGTQPVFSLGVADDSSPAFEGHVSLLSPHHLELVDGEAGVIYLDAPRWPLQDPEEAMLFRYFIDNLAPFLDMCDDERHFARIVPLRAATCCPLFHAILAYAAKRLSRLDNYDSLVADRYHQKCLNSLIPALSHSAAVIDENLLTSLILLRSMEELDVPISSPSPEFHLMGTRAFLEAQKSSCDFTGLRLASFWVALRQEIYMAFIHNRPVHSDFAFNNYDWLAKSDLTGCSVANRVIMCCAACLRYCHGSREQTITAWDELQDYLQQWWDERPWFYSPVYSDGTEEGEPAGFLPNEPYCNSAVVTGIQHYHLAKMLLAAHSPKVPRLGPGRRIAFNSMNDEIKKIVRIIVGIAESNQHTLPAYVTASMAITMAGDRFTERAEQEILYDVLTKTDRDLAWPTHSARQALRTSWGWD